MRKIEEHKERKMEVVEDFRFIRRFFFFFFFQILVFLVVTQCRVVGMLPTFEQVYL
jgi:hypothetical protein